MRYQELMDGLFEYYKRIENYDSQQAASGDALKFLEANSTPKEYMEIEGLVNAGFAENERIGFYHGFRCAVILMTGPAGDKGELYQYTNGKEW